MALIRHWWQIGLLGGVIAVVVLVIGLRGTRTYRASATILLTRSRSQLSLTEQFQTVTETGDAKSRMDAILTIAQSDSIARSALQKLQNKLPTANQTLEGIKSMVTVGNKGDAIIVTASNSSPEMSAEIANVWAQEVVQAVNQAYGGEQPIANIQVQLESTLKQYEKAQADLEAFIQSNQISALQRRIDESQKTLDLLEAQLTGAIELNIQTQTGIAKEQAENYLNTLLSQRKQVFTEQAQGQEQLLAYYYERKLELERLMVQAEALKQFLESQGYSSPGAAGDALAVLLARANAFGLSLENNIAIQNEDKNLTLQNQVGKDITIQLDANNISTLKDTPANYAADIGAIITQAAAEKAKTEEKIKELTNQLLQGEGYQYAGAPNAEDPLYKAGLEQIDALLDLKTAGSPVPDYQGRPLYNQIEAISAQIQQYQAQLESEQSQQRELTSDRDLAWTTYQTLQKKVTELQSTPQSSNTVALAGSAISPQIPNPRGTLKNVIVGGVAGVMLGAFWFLGREWWRSSGLANYKADASSIVSGSENQPPSPQ
jgi:capsular polysaccharide biosynthesis protein